MGKAKAKSLLWSLGRHWWVWMGVALYLLGLAPAVTEHVIPRWVYWLAALICIVIAFYKSWGEEYDRAELYKRELEEMYADVVLDWLKNNHPAIFTAAHVAQRMDFDVGRVTKGLKMLEKEFGVVHDNGARGWSFEMMISIPLISSLRRLVPPPKKELGGGV
jgi:hypothetical protein